jgi:pimeloyl-ACP methyl ester carboxylesterase
MSANTAIQTFADVGGTRLYYETAGSGSPLVFIHGFGSDSRVWEAQFEPFAQQYLAIRYDIRGHGKSALPGGEPYSHTADLKALLDHLNVPQATIIGQSMGGEIAIDFALTYPEKTASLVLVDSTIGGYAWSEEWADSWIPIYQEFATSGASAALPLLIAHPLFAPGFRQPAVKAHLGKILSEYSGWHILNSDPVIDNQPPAIECLERIQAQTLILVGQLDLPDFHAMSDLLAQKIPQSRKIEFAGAGHVLPMEEPEKFNGIVLSFLRS